MWHGRATCPKCKCRLLPQASPDREATLREGHASGAADYLQA